MTKFLIAYVVTAFVFLIIDYLWLGVLMKDYFQSELGHLMRDDVNLVIAAIFYLFFAIGIVVFCVNPALAEQSWKTALIYGGFFGFCAYATYDVTNLATLRDWPVQMAIIDVIWGTFITSVSALSGYFAVSYYTNSSM